MTRRRPFLYSGASPGGAADRLREGTLDRTWIENVIDTLDARRISASRAARTTKYTAFWLKKNPQVVEKNGKPVTLPPYKRRWGGPGVTYDSKRSLCIMYGGGVYGDKGTNCLWAYDAGQNTWTRLMEHNPRLDGKGRPGRMLIGETYRSPFVYDRKKDLYCTAAPGSKRRNFWAYSTLTNEWSERGISAKSIDAGPGYSTTLDSLVTPHVIINSEIGTITKLRSDPPDQVVAHYGWVGNTWWTPGCFDRSAADGTFLVFGGRHDEQLLDETWQFNPGKPKWKRLRPELSPTPRYRVHLTYHARLHVWVMFGGQSVGNETYVCT